jgi:hypothetical protein
VAREVAALDGAAGRCKGRGAVLGEDGPQVPFAEDQDAVGEFVGTSQDPGTRNRRAYPLRPEHRRDISRGRREAEAGSVAYVVLAALGLDISSSTVECVADWSHG